MLCHNFVKFAMKLILFIDYYFIYSIAGNVMDHNLLIAHLAKVDTI